MENEKKTHIDTFSGIGGFALAADRVFGNMEHVFVEWDPFCQEVLKKHWPGAEIHGDIRAFVAERKRTFANSNFRGRNTQSRSRTIGAKKRDNDNAFTSDTRPFLLTGGFPCQPFSQAGRRRGTEDDRYLWPPMLESIALFRPRWVIAENVAGLASWNNGLVLETVCADLEAQGYETQPFIIPACASGAPHRRDRIWIVAHANSDEHRGRGGSIRAKDGISREHREEVGRGRTGGAGANDSSAHAVSAGVGSAARETRDQGGRTGKSRTESIRQTHRSARAGGIASANRNASNTDHARHGASESETHPDRQKRIEKRHLAQHRNRGHNSSSANSERDGARRTHRSEIGEGERGRKDQDEREGSEVRSNASDSDTSGWRDGSWLEIATRLCRVDDGIPARLDRNPRLKALGNAIVPQVAEEIMRAIQHAEQ